MATTNDHSKRAHAVLSASSSARWLACPPSALAATAYESSGTSFTREGTFAHEIAEVYTRHGVIREEDANRLVPDGEDFDVQEAISCAERWGEYLDEQIKTPDHIQLAELRVDFSEWVPDGFGTADALQMEGHTLRVFDYKYGRGVAVDAENNPQMMLYALGALHDYGFVLDVEKIEMHIFQPRINNISKWEISKDDLMLWAVNTVKPTAEKAAEGKGRRKTGGHCRFCPHAGKCPTLTKECTDFIETHGGSKRAVKHLAPFEVAAVLEKEAEIQAWLKAVKAQAMSDMLDGKEIPGYKVVEGRQGLRKWTNEQDVVACLTEAGYPFEHITEVKLLSPAGMDKALGKAKAAELVGGLISRAPGAPVIVTSKDKRPVYNRGDDFENLEV